VAVYAICILQMQAYTACMDAIPSDLRALQELLEEVAACSARDMHRMTPSARARLLQINSHIQKHEEEEDGPTPQ
jgi:hypothetical protein